MTTDRNLLFGVIALQAELIDSRQFIEACTLWTANKNVQLADLLVEHGWILQDDKDHVDYLLERKIQKHEGDFRATLAAVPDDVKRSLTALDDADLQNSLADLPSSKDVETEALDRVSEPSDRYSLTRVHATGGTGRVWLARDHKLGRDVALKELRHERAKNDILSARFLREAKISSQLEHPGIVPVYELDYRPDDRQPFYTMRFVNGRTLTQAARDYHDDRAAGRDKPFELSDLLNAFVGVCNTVSYAHSRGVIHRDLKGQNVIIGEFGEVIVLDWGLAKLMHEVDEEPTAETPLDEAASGVELTLQGQTIGTPAYMAPEQAAGHLELIGPRTDVYGLGAILYEILTGHPPFTGAGVNEVLRKVKEEPPLPPHDLWEDVPQILEATCLRALAKNPGERYSSASEVTHEVQHWQEVQRKQAEEALAQERYLLHTLMDNVPDNIWFKDTDSRFIRVNKSLARYFGLHDPSDALGKTDFDFFTEQEARTRCEDERRVMATGEAIVGKEEIEKWLDGRARWVSTTKMPFRDKDGNIIGTFGISRDITGLKQTE